MNKDYYTVDEISNMLNIHPKTIQRYIREGKLRAAKIGKGWRVTGHDLSTFIENDSYEKPASDNQSERSVIASSVIDIIVDGKEDAIRIMNTLTASLNSKPSEYGQSSMQSQYIERENMVRITLWGGIRFMAIMMDTIAVLTENNKEERIYMKQSVFKTEAGRDRFRAYYNQVLSRFPFEQQYIKTTFGQTFMLTAGQESKPPVILLHGSCSNSAFWFPEIMALSSNYKVYAVDIIGEAGNSEEYRPDLNSDAFAVWMKDVLDVLGLEKAVIIGNSLGGWMSLKFAAAYPERVSKLVLIASAGLAEVRQQFISDVEQTRQEDGTVPVDSTILGEHNIPKEVLDFMNLIVESYNPIQHLPVYGDEQLQRLNMPVLFIDGENDVIIDADKSAQRLSRIVPSAEIHLLMNCGHVLTNSIEYIIPFLAETA